MSFGFRQTIHIEHRGPGEYNQYTGKYETDETETRTIQASVHPLKGEMILKLPEGRRHLGGYVLYTDALLNFPKEGGHQGDVALLYGGRYEVLSVEYWDNGLLPHNRYYCGKMPL